MQQQPQDHQHQNGQMAMLNYRVNALEQALKALQSQFVPRTENDLQIKSMRESQERMEKMISDPETGLQTQISELRASIDRLIIRVLWGAVGGIGTILVGIAVYYFTHLP